MKFFSSNQKSVNRFIYTSIEAIRAFDWQEYAAKIRKEPQLRKGKNPISFARESR